LLCFTLRCRSAAVELVPKLRKIFRVAYEKSVLSKSIEQQEDKSLMLLQKIIRLKA